MATGHRVESKRARQAPLPKEVEPVQPYVYRDRFGNELIVVWNGHRDHGSPSQSQMEQPR
jgi:hypothetical protein